MKVAPAGQKAKTEQKMKNGSKRDQYLVFGIRMFAYFLGLSPYKFNAETGEVSFKWFSCETLWCFLRLVLFNSPFSFLPVVFFAIFGRAEWENLEWGKMPDDKNTTIAISNATLNATPNATSNATSSATLNAASNATAVNVALNAAPVYQILFTLEYVSYYSFFILLKVAKSKVRLCF